MDLAGRISAVLDRAAVAGGKVVSIAAVRLALEESAGEHGFGGGLQLVVLAHIPALIGDPIGGGTLADRLSLESGRLAGEFVNLREELGHYKRVVNGSIPDHLMGRHNLAEQVADDCLMCQRAVLADDNARLRAEVAKSREEIRRLRDTRCLDENMNGQECHLPMGHWPDQPHRYDDRLRPGAWPATGAEFGASGDWCSCPISMNESGHLASEHTDCGGHPPCGGCHQCLLRQMHHAKRLADREQWSVPCPTCHMPAGKACVDAAGLLPEHLNHPARAAAHADSRAGQAGEEVGEHG